MSEREREREPLVGPFEAFLCTNEKLFKIAGGLETYL